jgi:hypothetical protein
MALKDIVVETDSVTYNGQTIPLRGITTNDIKAVLVRARNSADLLFDLAERKGVKSEADLTEDMVKDIAHSAIAELPVLVSTVIAQSADDIENAHVVERLPVPVQLDCLRKIARMTFTDATNFGEFLGNVSATVKAMNSLSHKEGNQKRGEPRPRVGLRA